MSQFALFITVTLNPGTEDAFMPIIQENAAASVRDESGCRVFDVLLPHGGAKDIVYLYEIYDDDAAFAAHQASPHYKNFKETTGDIVANMDVVRMSM